MSTESDPLTEAWARRTTKEVAALLRREKGANRVVNGIRADIGDRCRVMERRLPAHQYGRWRSEYIHPDRSVAKQYLDLSRLRSENVDTYQRFAELNPCKLARIAALPLPLSAKLTPDTVLAIPEKNLSLAIRDMGFKKLDAALDALEGKRTAPRGPKTALACVAELEDLAKQDPKAFASIIERLQALAGCPNETLPDSKEGRAAVATQQTKKLLRSLALVNGGVGALSAAERQGQVDLWEDGRREILRWKAPGPAGIRRRAPVSPGP